MNMDELKSYYEKQYGITIDNIELKKLSNGSNLVAFYDPKLGRKRLIDYNSSTELNMIDIDSFRANYNEIIKRIPANEQYKVAMINKLLNQSESREYKYIDLENMTALDNKGNIVEASLNRENEVQVGMTNSYETTTTIEEQTEEPKTEIVETSQNTIIEDAQDFRKVVEEEMEKHHIQGSLEEEYNKVMQYSNDMTKLEDDYANKLIDDNKYDFYKVCAEAYVNSKTLENVKNKSLVYGPQSGFVSILIIAYIAIMISILALLLINL